MRPESLATQIIKAKYYKNCFFLEAIVGPRPSFAWRSLIASQALLKNSLLWRIGDGWGAKVWGTQWIPNLLTYLVQLPINGLGAKARVIDLID